MISRAGSIRKIFGKVHQESGIRDDNEDRDLNKSIIFIFWSVYNKY